MDLFVLVERRVLEINEEKEKERFCTLVLRTRSNEDCWMVLGQHDAGEDLLIGRTRRAVSRR